MDNLKDFLNVAIESAKISKQIHQHYAKHGFSIESKSTPTDIVTTADTEAEKAIYAHIQKSYPDHSFWGEESGKSETEHSHRWIIDPVDGTTNFAHGFPFYCTSIALEISGSLKIGVILDSTREELFWAVENEGAYLNDDRIFVTNHEKMETGLFSTGFTTKISEIIDNRAMFDKTLEKGLSIRIAGSAALDLCYVAAGRVDGFWELYLKPWDVAAGKIIVQEAGGKITTIENGAHTLESRSILASNGKVHDPLIQVLQS